MMKLVRLDEIAKIQIGKTPKRAVNEYWGKGFPWVSIADMKTEVINQTKEQITEQAIKECGCKLIPKGSLIMSFKLSVGKLAFAGTDLFTNEAICAILIKDQNRINDKYFYYALKNTKLTGSNMAVMGHTLNTESLNSLKIPLIGNLSDQIRIAEILSQAESLIAKRKQSISLLDELLKSTFLEMFGKPNHFKKADTIKTIGQICQFKGGGTPSKSKPEFFTGNIPWVSPKDMKSLYITTSQDKITEQAIKESSTSLIPKGAVLMVVRSGILKSKLPVAINNVDVTINQDMKAFVSKEVLSSYLLYFFRSNEKNILKKVRATTADNFNFEDIKNLKIIVPPISLQTQFATIVEKVEALKTQYQQSLTELQNMYGVLSQKAFKGELKPSSPALLPPEKGVRRTS
jgi:type I restriction enzyme S subunit